MLLNRINDRERWALGLILLAGLLLRGIEFPRRYEVPPSDTIGYVDGGLALLEGITPGYKMAPAGPTTWLSWSWAAARSARYVLLPTAEERAVPMQVRPFVAVNHALFDDYRDLSSLNLFLSAISVIAALAATSGAFFAGRRIAGLHGAVLAAGLVALLPLFLEYSIKAKPYTLAWSAAIGAWSVAVCGDRRRAGAAAFLLGLSIASRIDMLVLVPLIAWHVYERSPADRKYSPLLSFFVITFATVLVFAPWLVTNLIGNLRAIATIRFSPPTFMRQPVLTIAGDLLLWGQGFLPTILLMCAAPLLVPKYQRLRCAAAVGFTLFLLAAIFKGSGFGLRHDAAALLATIMLAGLSLPALVSRWPRLAIASVALSLALPAACAIAQVRHVVHDRVVADSTAWLEEHVPAGTRVYMFLEASLKLPLPTAESADLLWSEVTDGAAWRKKFASGLARFNLSADQFPRALSEENLIQTRGNRREFFILASRPAAPHPRFDLRLIQDGPVTGVPYVEFESTVSREPGVVIWRGDASRLPTTLGLPLAQWGPDRGEDTIYIFAPASIRAKLAGVQ